MYIIHNIIYESKAKWLFSLWILDGEKNVTCGNGK